MLTLALAAVVWTAQPAPAAAAPSRSSEEALADDDQGEWYGLVPTVIDAASVGLVLGAVTWDHLDPGASIVRPMFAVGEVGLVLGFVAGAGNHIYRGHSGRALPSLALRLVGAAATYGILSIKQSPCGTQESPNCNVGLRLLVAGLPLMAAMAFDDLLLSRDVPPWDRPARVALAPSPLADKGYGVTLFATF